MALILYLSVACAVPLLLTIQSLIPLLPLLSLQLCTKLRLRPEKLSGLQITVVILFLLFKRFLKPLRIVPALRQSHVGDSPTRNEDAFDLPDVRLEMQMIVSRADMKRYETAACAPNTASPTGSNSLFLLSPVAEPLMLLLLARPACPILPLGSVNVRNRFEFFSPVECRNVSLRARLRAEASLRRKGRRVKRGVEFDVVIDVFSEDKDELIFRQVMTILQFLNEAVEPRWHESSIKEGSIAQSPLDDAYKTMAEETVAIQKDAPLKWAALCKDYNPIHVSAFAAKLFGFPSMIAHGNQAAAMMVEKLATTAQSSIKSLWLDSSRASFMEVEFRRPMVVPQQLCIATADGTNTYRSKESDEALLISQKQIIAWVAEARLPDNVQQAANTLYQRVYNRNAFKHRNQDAVMVGCIFVACRDCNTPRTFSEISGVTRIAEKEIDTVYPTFERFLSNAQDETLQHFRLQQKDKVYVEGRIGWLGQK